MMEVLKVTEGERRRLLSHNRLRYTARVVHERNAITSRPRISIIVDGRKRGRHIIDIDRYRTQLLEQKGIFFGHDGHDLF